MLKFLFIILNSLIISATVNFSVDMSNIDFPNDSYQSAVVNGSWNSWSGWGVTLNDDNEDGIYEGVLEVENGTYEYVIALTGTEDNWSGWGQTINAPIGSSVTGTQMISGLTMDLTLITLTLINRTVLEIAILIV